MGEVFLGHQRGRNMPECVKDSARDGESVQVDISFTYKFSDEKDVEDLMKLLETFVNENNKGLVDKRLEMRKWY